MRAVVFIAAAVIGAVCWVLDREYRAYCIERAKR